MLLKNTPERKIEMDPLEDAGKVTGFSSPATDYSQDRLHIIQKLVKDPTNRIKGNSVLPILQNGRISSKQNEAVAKVLS